MTELSVQLEHRLTQIEDQMAAGFSNLEHRAKGIEVEVAGLKSEVKQQNGRVYRLEIWQVRMLTLGALFVALGPFLYLVLHGLVTRTF